MNVKCLVVDDEPLARKLIVGHIQKLENFEVVAECGDAMKALHALRLHQVDLMFTDIRMPQITGIDFLKILKDPPRVIFTTAHREYAIEGFELDVIDFLLKPISFERFLKAIDKYFQVSIEPVRESVTEKGEPHNNNPYIYVRENKKAVKLYLNEIVYVEGLSEYVQIYTLTRKLITKITLGGMQEILPANYFMRIHKSYIVSLPKIEAFTSTSIEVPGKMLPIGRSYKQTVLTALQ